MIIWINGAFGSGKTQAAYGLQRRIPNSYVYDPENVGFFIRKNIPPSINKDDFQDYPMWRKFNYDMLDYISEHCSGHIIVPMTITDKQYYDEIIGTLSKKYEGKHIILYAKKETFLQRLASRLEGKRSWAAQQIDRCIKSFSEDITEYKIYTDDLNIDQVIEQIAAVSTVTLSEDSRNNLRKRSDRFIVQCKHIRN